MGSLKSPKIVQTIRQHQSFQTRKPYTDSHHNTPFVKKIQPKTRTRNQRKEANRRGANISINSNIQRLTTRRSSPHSRLFSHECAVHLARALTLHSVPQFTHHWCEHQHHRSEPVVRARQPQKLASEHSRRESNKLLPAPGTAASPETVGFERALLPLFNLNLL